MNLFLSITLLSHLNALVWTQEISRPSAKPGLQSPLPSVPANLPSWMNSRGLDELFYKQAPYNWAINRIPAFARDMYATGVGHAMAYEALVTGKSPELENKTFNSIDWVLKNPPRLPVDEAAISPKFVQKYGYLEKVFDWAHTLHFQTIDVLAHPGWTDHQKEVEVEKLWEFYQSEPFAITGLPMNMEYLDSFPYSGKFRTKFPKVNGLFWGYHWLQTVNYDMLYRVPVADQGAQYELLGQRYRETELYRIDRDFMPMTAELSPRFAKRFPHIANAFDNLHMLHDNVNDILADDNLNEHQKAEQVKIAIYRVLSSSHLGEESGEGEALKLHDHRHPSGMPGMGMMLGSDEDTMFMSGMGWMDMSECAHCSISFPDEGPWGATVTAEGWTMTVRCMMCARDMAAETPGRAIIRAATENENKLLVMISDEEGNWTSNIKEVVFLEVVGEHPNCSIWSRAFTSKDAFYKFIATQPDLKEAKPLSLVEWSKLNNGKPETYRKLEKPNPYRRKPVGQILSKVSSN